MKALISNCVKHFASMILKQALKMKIQIEEFRKDRLISQNMFQLGRNLVYEYTNFLKLFLAYLIC